MPVLPVESHAFVFGPIDSRTGYGFDGDRYDRPRSKTPESARYGLAWSLQTAGEHEGAVRLLAPLETEDTEPELRIAALELCVWAHASAGAPDKAVPLGERALAVA